MPLRALTTSRHDSMAVLKHSALCLQVTPKLLKIGGKDHPLTESAMVSASFVTFIVSSRGLHRLRDGVLGITEIKP